MAFNIFRNHTVRLGIQKGFKRNAAKQVVYSDPQCADTASKALILGLYVDENDQFDNGLLTPTATRFNKRTCGRLLELVRVFSIPKKGEVRVIYGLEQDWPAVAVVGLGKECLGYNSMEEMDEGKEAVRYAAAVGCRFLQDIRAKKIYVETLGNAESAAEGSAMAIYIYQEYKTKKITLPYLEMYADGDCDWEGWQIGLQKAAAQNLARQLSEAPSNLMTPTVFAQTAVEVLCKTGVNVEVKVGAWAESQKMNAFLAAAKGSCEPPIFLELSYYGAGRTERPIVIIGKGCTFDSGGTCLLYDEYQKNMRGDMTGAAIVVAACRTIASLQLPLNIRGLIPLCEHMPGCNAMKPGDIVTAMNGKSIEIQDTHNEGRLMLADTLLYAQNYWPRFILDIGTLTKCLPEGLGQVATPIFTNSEDLWQNMRMAGVHTGDRVWRFPLWRYYSEQVTAQRNVEVQNTGIGRGGDPCKAAAFLREFVPCGEWIHVDNYNVMATDGADVPYLRKTMTGRPTRTIVEFLAQLVCRGDDECA